MRVHDPISTQLRTMLGMNGLIIDSLAVLENAVFKGAPLEIGWSASLCGRCTHEAQHSMPLVGTRYIVNTDFARIAFGIASKHFAMAVIGPTSRHEFATSVSIDFVGQVLEWRR